MKIVTLIPKTLRAKTRVREHGTQMILLEEKKTKFLVRSIKKTWNHNSDYWSGWFDHEEASFVVTDNTG